MSLAFLVAFVSDERDRNCAGLFALAHRFGQLGANQQRDVEAVAVVDCVHDDEGVDRADPARRNVGTVVHSGTVVHFKPEFGLEKNVGFNPFAVGCRDVSEFQG